ncbi:CWF19-like protein 2 [Uloborus diversus]|uniref:CWF19-like protein 2 n=1 Tax=Uloborus diversus TaxID=327109 RepID=UPI00240952AC|nr:CWF19-like protein 2 [Uloborus diversus]
MKETKQKKHHQKSSKHKKKSKKQKKKRHVGSSSSDSDSQDCEMEWVEASSSLTQAHAYQSKNKPSKEEQTSSDSSDSDSGDITYSQKQDGNVSHIKRDDWMNEESFVPTLSKSEMFSGSSRQNKKEIAKLQREKELVIQQSRELNPYMKTGDKGLPSETSHAEDLQLPSTSVGDHGYSWLKKAYLRIQEQAQEQGRTMEEVAVERWGSLDKLVSMIKEAESRLNEHSKLKHRERARREEEEIESRRSRKSDRFEKPDDISPNHSPQRSFKFQKPSETKHHRSNLHFSSSKNHKKYERHYDDNDRERHRDSREKRDKYERHYDDDDKEGHKYPKEKSDKYEDRSNAISSAFNKHDDSRYDRKRDIKSSFQKPSHEDKFDYSIFESKKKESGSRVPAWKKKNYEESKNLEKEESIPMKVSGMIDQNLKDDFKSTKPVLSRESADESYSQKSSNKDKSPVFYTNDDLSKLASKVFKAELLGDKELTSKLQKELDEARKFVVERPLRKAKQEEEVVLMKRDSSGQVQPLRITNDDMSSCSHQKGKKSKFFDDGSKYSLKQMFEREKLTTADDNLEMFMEVAAECKEATEIDYEMDDVAKKVSQKMSHNRQEEKDIGKAIRQHQKRQSALEKCIYCLDQPNMKHHLIADIGIEAYLCLPSYQSIVEGHCLIVPKVHVSSLLCLDEDEWREIEDYKRRLRNMFKAEHKSVVFLETSMNFRYCPHAVLECVPVPFEDGDMAPMYFKKAIQESEAEWAHNIKLVDLTKKGLRNSVPKNLPYFFVEFDPEIHAGFAHVIEDEKMFPRNFGKEVVGGMLDIDYNHLYKNKKEDPLKKSNEVLLFGKKWKKYKDES